LAAESLIMIEILEAPDHVFAARFVDALTGADFEVVEREIEARLARHGRIGIVADVTGLKSVTPEALAKDLRYNISKLGHWRQFPREAVITQRAWMAAVTRVLDPLVPHVEVRPFHPDEQAAAISWAADFPPEA
jgi:hypothetical protein